MIKEIIATGVDANAAIESGALLLGLPREEVQFEIIDLPRKGGFLGLKKLPAKVRVWVELPDEKPARSEKPRRQEAPKKEQKAENKPTAPKAEKPARSEKPAPRVEKPIRVEAEKPAPVEIEPTGEVRAKVEKAAAYVTEILKAMGLTDFTLTPRYYEENVRLQLAGEQIGGVIGRRGETLDAIQYLASLVANRGEGEYIRLSIDSGNYREKRARTLEALARKLANQAVRTGRSITLEPMNPYERRIIHGAVSTVKGATSSSTGVEPNRRVVISSTVPPTGGKEGSREGGRGGRNGRGGNRRGNGGRGNGGERRRPIAPAETGAEREHAAAVIILPQRRERVRGELSGSIARKRKRHGLVVFHGAYAPDRFRHAEIYEPRARAHRRARAEIRRAGIPDASADDEELSVIALVRFGSAPRHGHAAAIPVYAHGLRHIPVHGFHPLR